MFRRFLLVALLLHTASAMATEHYGPYRAEVLRVIDGDTVELAIALWPGLTMAVNLRLDGINTPEKRGNIAACEKSAGEAASRFTAEWLAGVAQVEVDDIKPGKYAGRMLGRIVKNGEDLSSALIAAGLARPYDGGRREPWCH